MAGPQSLHLASFPPAGAQLPAGAIAEHIIPGFDTNEDQARLNWCWAAVLSSVSRVLPPPGGPQTQRQVVERVQGAAGLAADDMADLLAAIRQMRWRCLPLFESDLPNIDFVRDIRTPIDDGRPIPIMVRWQRGGGHAICAFGYGQLGGQPALIIYDPSQIDEERDNLTMVSVAGMSRYESQLLSGRERGRWVEAYIMER